ncbi:MAG: SpoIIE family protein phosphatase [Phycisphaerales bacterium]|nr:SpoIIE family protein phosphatase [Phycisphaerales bacterium]
MPRPISIRTSLLRDLAALVLLLGLAVFAATFVGARQTVRALSESLTGQSLSTISARLDTFFAAAQDQLEVAASQAAAGGFDLDPQELGSLDAAAAGRALRDKRNALFAPIIRATPQISSVLIADSGGHEHMLLRAPTGWRNRCTAADDSSQVRWLEWTDGVTPSERTEDLAYDPRERPWFQDAVHSTPGTIHWTAPYIFFTSHEPGITASMLYPRPDGLVHVLGMDVRLKDISEFTRALRVGGRGMAAVLTSDGRLIGLPGLSAFDAPAAADTAYLQPPEALGLTLLDDAIAARAGHPDSRPFRFRSGGEAWWACTRPYPLTADDSLRVAVLLPEADLLGNLARLRLTILGIIAVVLVAALFRAAWVARRFSSPIEALVAQSERIARGDLDAGESVVSRVKEIRRLVKAQELMREGIRARMQLQKVERDLDLARDIQRGLLPRSAPAAAGFEIAGWNQPADQTGGDFYDWIALPDHRIAFTLADVTGHGIGPALIVAVYRAYMRASTSLGSAHLADALRHVNNLLCDDIPDNRFITTVVGVLDSDLARVTMISAGHGPLYFYRAATGEIDRWNADVMPLGLVSDMDFRPAREVDFAPGDMLFVVTDGFFEWAGPEGEQFGLGRLEAFIREHQHLDGEAFIQALYQAVLAHAAGEPQSDDLTALMIRRR